MPITLTQRHELSAGGTRVVRVNCTADLDDGASLTGTVSADDATGVLTITDKTVNSAAYSDSVTGKTVAIGKGFRFTVTGGVAGTTYRVACSCGTNSTPAEVLPYDVLLTYI